MQKRLVRKLDLEIALSKIGPHPSPKAVLEQYTIPPKAASELLYTAAYIHDDIADKTVVDLGCGTGTLAIGSALLGARETVGVDIDRIAVRIAKKRANILGVGATTQWIIADVATIRGSFDTVLQNPPFGVQKRKADRRFLRKALEIGKRVYSLHKSSSKNLLIVEGQSGDDPPSHSGDDNPLHFVEEIEKPAGEEQVQRREKAQTYGKGIEGDGEPAHSVKGLRRKELAYVSLLHGQRRNYRENVTEAIDNVNRRGNSEPDPEDPPFPEKTAAGHGKG